MTPIRTLALIMTCLGAFAGNAQADATGPINIGDINSYGGAPSYTIPSKNGMLMAIDEINKAGGIAGRKLALVSADDSGDPGKAARLVEEMVMRDDVVAIGGFAYSHVALAASEMCLRHKVTCLAAYGATDHLLTANPDNNYIFRVVPSVSAQTRMLLDQLDKQNTLRWTLLMPQFEFGQSLARAFETHLPQSRPQDSIADTIWTPLRKIDAGAVVNKLRSQKPEALFVGLTAQDSTAFTQEGIKRELFADMVKTVAKPYHLRQDAGEMFDKTPAGWHIFTYNPAHHTNPAHMKFVDGYRLRYKNDPDEAALIGYTQIYAFAAAMKKSGGISRAVLRDNLDGLENLETPLGDGVVSFPKGARQSTFGRYFAVTAAPENGAIRFEQYRYIDGAAYIAPPTAQKKEP